jgi:glycosyltransferase involved in cell wall biosynthesis
VSHFGVDTAIFKKRASMPQNPRFISVGSLTVRKGQQYLFRAFEKVKAVILGQDPYHGPGQAHGLCFSVREGVDYPPSLVNIFREIK